MASPGMPSIFRETASVRARLDSYSTRKDLRHALNGNSVRIIGRVIRGIRVKLFGRGPLLHLHDEPAGQIIVTAEH